VPNAHLKGHFLRKLSSGHTLVCTLFSARGISVAAPKIWNSLPPALQICTSPPTLFIIVSSPQDSSRPSNPINAFLLAPQIRLLLTTVRVYKLVHGQVTIIFVVSVCLFVCAEFFSAVFDPISIKLGHMLYVWV